MSTSLLPSVRLAALFALSAAAGIAPLSPLATTRAFAAPIVSSGAPTSLPAYSGAASDFRPLKVKKPPKHPFMAKNGRSNVHNDAWMTDTYWGKGPIGNAPYTLSIALGQDCISIAFDRKGRIVTACSNLTTRTLYVIDPLTLQVLDSEPLPYVEAPMGQDPFTSSSGGIYFYLDRQDRALVGAADGRLLVYSVSKDAPFLALDSEYDLTAALAGDRITSALPDWQGRVWFIGRYTGVVGVLDLDTGNIETMLLNEEIENSFAVAEEGVYIVTDTSMYRLEAGDDDVPVVVWSQEYQNSGIAKIGQFNAGSGTTPTIMNGGYVAITDNADPMNVVVYRRAETLELGQDRVVCEVPVFGAGASATENSLIATGNSLIVENNFGYYITTTMNGAVSSPGITRIDVREDGSGCDVVWTSTEVAPSCVPKVSTKTGLVYLYTKDPDPVNTTSDAWFWTALDFATGETVWKRLAGTGLSFNNHYAGIALGPKGRPTAYVGTVGGIVAVRDSK
jgi:hypothetical protein